MDMETEIVHNLVDDFNKVMQQKKEFNHICYAEIEEIIYSVRDSLFNLTCRLKEHDHTPTEILPLIEECWKIYRTACSLDSTFQDQIATIPHFFEYLLFYLYPWLNPRNDQSTNDRISLISRISWQCLANLSVGNDSTQDLIWNNLNSCLYVGLNDDHDCVDICTMIVYNIFIGKRIDCEAEKILKSLLKYLHWETQKENIKLPDFLQIFLEHFIVDHRGFIPIYATLDDSERLLLLFFITDHLKQQEKDRFINRELLQFICKDFKQKSDYVLKTVTSYVDNIQPKEVVALLDVIAAATNHIELLEILSVDGSLFLNIGCLLQSLHAIGKKSENIFTPMTKLDYVAPNSAESSTFEKDFSYGLKSTLVRVLGNLAHGSRKNQDLAREMEILQVVLECTCMDGRNPLIKEWSILAIRYLCANNIENQQIIAGLTKVGEGDNSDILKEFNIDMGSLRIGNN